MDDAREGFAHHKGTQWTDGRRAKDQLNRTRQPIGATRDKEMCHVREPGTEDSRQDRAAFGIHRTWSLALPCKAQPEST